eukprot:jgi/Psemu1/285340/fgenesh1_pg.82_\
MPPSIPPHDAPTNGGTSTTRLSQLRRETRSVKLKHSPGNGNGNGTLRPTRGSERRLAQRSTTPQRSNRKKKIVLLRKKQSNSGPLAASSSSSHRHPEANEESGNSASTIQNEDGTTAAGSMETTTTQMQMPSALDSTGLAPYGGIGSVSPYGLYGGGASMMMPPSPYMGMNTMGGMPYLSGLNQVVYNVQNIIFSISQAVYVVGANQQALQQAWESLNQMVDHAVATFHEMRALDCMEREHETEEEKQKRKRLKALRYAFVFGGGWLAYKLIRNLLFRKRTLSLRGHTRLQQQQQQQQQSNSPEGIYSAQPHLSYNASMTSPGANAVSSYLSSPSMGFPGYSGNYYNGGSGYY